MTRWTVGLWNHQLAAPIELQMHDAPSGGGIVAGVYDADQCVVLHFTL